MTQPAPSRSQAPAPPNLSAETFKKLVDIIYQISGMRFQDNKQYFVATKLNNRLIALGIKTFEDYISFLKTPQAQKHEHQHLMDEITINETFFFRNQPQLEAFETDVLTPLLRTRRSQGRKNIRIWSCAASTGDEAYTTALQLMSMEAAKEFQIDIVGTDICSDAIAKAKAGVYKKYAVRNIPPNLMQRYFTADEKGLNFTISDEVKRRVRFLEGNLIDRAQVNALGQFDISFCRNVLIYFDEKSKEDALWNIYNALADDGALLVGHSENIYSQRHIFKADNSRSRAIAYIKAPPGTPKLSV